MKKCELCGTELPQIGTDYYIRAISRLGPIICCAPCLKSHKYKDYIIVKVSEVI